MRANLLLRTVCAAIVACLPAFAASAQTKVVAGIPSPILPYMAGVVYARIWNLSKSPGPLRFVWWRIPMISSSVLQRP